MIYMCKLVFMYCSIYRASKIKLKLDKINSSWFFSLFIYFFYFVCMCIYIMNVAYVCVMHTHTSVCQKTWGFLLDHFLSHVLEVEFFSELWVSLADRKPQQLCCPLTPRALRLQVDSHIWLFTWVLGIWTHILVLVWHAVLLGKLSFALDFSTFGSLYNEVNGQVSK